MQGHKATPEELLHKARGLHDPLPISTSVSRVRKRDLTDPTGFLDVDAVAQSEYRRAQKKNTPTQGGDAPVLAGKSFGLALEKMGDLTYSHAHAAFLDKLWGAGYSGPGGLKPFEELLDASGIVPGSKVLFIGDHLGRSARQLVRKKPIWADILTWGDADVGTLRRRCQASDVGNRVQVISAMPGAIPQMPTYYDTIVARESFHTFFAKKNIFSKLRKILNTGGRMAFTEFVVNDSGLVTDHLMQWMEYEPRGAYPWAAKQYDQALVKSGFKVLVCEDVSDIYRAWVLKAWAIFLAHLKKNDISRIFGEIMTNQCELWLRRTQAMETGGIQVKIWVVENQVEKEMPALSTLGW